MSELNDDLLNYELGDDIDDQALYGADEDELLLSDDELEKDVTKEEKQQLKAEAEQWVQSQIQEKNQLQENQHQQQQQQTPHELETIVQKVNISEAPGTVASAVAPNATTEPNEVSSTAAASTTAGAAQIVQSETLDGVSTSVEESQKLQGEFKEPIQQQVTQTQQPQATQTNLLANNNNGSNADEVTSSSSKELEMDHSSIISCSTSITTDSSCIQSSQESISFGAGLSVTDYSDPREDFEEEREERTNIKTTNERDVDQIAGNEQSPEKHQSRYMQGKRGVGNALLVRPHGIRGLPYHHGQRPLLRFPPHGNFPILSPSFPTLATVTTTTLTHTSSPLIPGQFPPQQSMNPYAPLTLHPPPPGPAGSGPASGQALNPNTQNMPLLSHDPMNLNQGPRQRPPFSGYRGGAPMAFRPSNPNSVYSQVPHEYGGGGAPNFPSNFGHPARSMFRPELGPMMNAGPGMPPAVMRTGMRNPRPPLQNLAQPNMASNYVTGPPLRPQQPLPQQQLAQLPPAGAAGSSAAAVQPQIAVGLPASATLQRPSKVLINPNFKGGVEAAKNKFIKETQFMSSIRGHVSHLQSDDELLRQQEEFINKNRQHIEKRRQERSSPPPVSRRSRSRSRTRSHSRERSYSPPKRGAVSPRERHFERERDRGAVHERFTERERERGRGNSRERERGVAGSSNTRSNRFRRASSRERDYENRSTYGKRRRSTSPNRGASSGGGRRGGERERNDVEEDEETRAYRLEIEKQKALREKILRDKEMKRRRAAEEKLHEEKRTTQASNSNVANANANEEQQQSQQPQKLKPLIVTERKMISLKKRQQQQQQQRRESNERPLHQQQHQRKQIPTAKILPEAKRTLTDHLTNVAGGGGGGSGGHTNTAIIKPVQKKEASISSTPPPKRDLHHLATPSDDEVELDYDEDELMLEDEERLLATPTPSPNRLPASRTPTPEPPLQQLSQAKQGKMGVRNIGSGSSQAKGLGGAPFASSNRRVILKSSSSSSAPTAANSGGSSGRREISNAALDAMEAGRSRRGNSRHRENNHSTGNGTSGSGSSKGVFERLDARKQQLQAGNNDGGRRKGQQRIVLKHHD